MPWHDRLWNVWRTARLNREIERELAFHVAETEDALQASGMSAEQARQEARRRLGNSLAQRERTRDADIVQWLDTVWRDLRHAVRGLLRAPVFALVAIASLALGIGANTAIFTLIDAVVLRPLPVPSPSELVVIGMGGEQAAGTFTNPLWEELRERQTGMSAVAAFSESRFNTVEGGEPRRVDGVMASGDYFRLFGVRPALGRLLGTADDVRGCAPVAVLGHGYWQTEYGGAADVLGRSLALDGVAFEIVGATAPGFTGAEVGRETQVYVPLCAEAAVRGERSALDARSTWWLRIMGRREPNLSMEQLGARLAAIAPASYEATVPQHYGTEQKATYVEGELTVSEAASGLSGVRQQYAGALTMLMAAVGLVLLIACANVANLLLARAASRQREFAIRVAIGAGRARVARQLVTESLLFAGIGATLGIVLARYGAQGLTYLISDGTSPIALDLSLNARVLGFTTGVAVLTALLFGLVPAWRAARVDPHTTMTARGRSIAEGHGRFTLGKALVAAQVALSLVLLVGAGLLIGSLRNLSTMDPGFTSDGVLIANLDARRAAMEPEQLAIAHARLLERLSGMPGVHSASLSTLTPIGFMRWNEELIVDGFTPSEPMDAVAWFNEVSPGYFATLETRLLAGRDFDESDVAAGAPVAIISQSVARKFFGDGNPIGRTYRTRRGDELSEPVSVIGVVEDAKYSSLREETSLTVYRAASQGEASPFVSFEARADGDPRALIEPMKAAVAEIHPAISVSFTTLSDQIAQSLQRERLLAVLSGLFGGLALALAMLGLYGVMSYAVARRRSEIGVRIALGAGSARVLRMVLGDVGRVVALGLTVGFIGAVASGRLVTGFLYGMTPAQPSVMVLAGALLALVALTAGFIPAWRAARLDPTTALRDDA